LIAEEFAFGKIQKNHWTTENSGLTRLGWLVVGTDWQNLAKLVVVERQHLQEPLYGRSKPNFERWTT